MMKSPDFYDGLEFLRGVSFPSYLGWIDTVFPDFYSLQYLSRGTITFRLGGGKTIRLEAPHAWITFPGPRFEFGHKTEAWDYRYVAFKGSRVADYIRRGLFPVKETPPVFQIHSPDQFRRIFDELLLQISLPQVRNRRAVHTFEGLLLQLFEQDSPPENRTPNGKKIFQIAEGLRRQPLKEWDFKQLASGGQLSYSHFRRLFRELTGLAPHEYLTEVRLERAAHALEDAAPSLSEVASVSGFGDVYHFSRLFKKRFHVSPGKYREQFGVGGRKR